MQNRPVSGETFGCQTKTIGYAFSSEIINAVKQFNQTFCAKAYVRRLIWIVYWIFNVNYKEAILV